MNSSKCSALETIRETMFATDYELLIIRAMLGTFNVTSISVATHTFDAKNKICAVRIKARIINNMFSECKIKF